MPQPQVQEVDELDRSVRLGLYGHFLAHGRPPAAAETAQALGLPAEAVEESYDRLAAARVIVLRPGTREVLMANPLSAVPTRFTARLADGRSFYGNCIWDVLGIPAMLGQDAVIGALCGDCDDRLELEVREGRLARSEGVVHFGVPAARWWEDIVFT